MTISLLGISETTKFSYSEVIVPRKLEAEVDGSKVMHLFKKRDFALMAVEQ